MLTPRLPSRERTIFLGIVAFVIVAVTIGILVSFSGSRVSFGTKGIETLQQLQNRIPKSDVVQQTLASLEQLSPFLLRRRVSSEPARQVGATSLDTNSPVLPSSVQIDDPGIGTTLVLRWTYPVAIPDSRDIGIWKSRVAGTLGDRVATLRPGVTTWVDWNAEHSVSFWYSIQALLQTQEPNRNAAQYVGQAVDRLPPDPPQNVTVSSGATPHTLHLTWEFSESSDVIGVNIYRSTASGELGARVAERVAGTQWEDATIQSGVRYYYTVTSVDRAGNESRVRLERAPEPRANPFEALTPEAQPTLEPKNTKPSRVLR